MKLLLALSLLAIPAFAEDNTDGLPAYKQELVSNIDARIAAENKFKGCVQSSADTKALKACQEAYRQAAVGIKKDLMDERIKLMEARTAKMKEKRSQVGQPTK